MLDMEDTKVQSASAAAQHTKTSGWLLLFVALGLLWFELVIQLKGEWWLNPQYNYGLIVPVLLVYLLWRRWPNRPASTNPITRALPVLVMVAGALVFLPIRLVAEANPDWRLLSWALALDVVAISLAVVYLNGGGSWLRHFAFPFLFFLVAVPWPVRIEQLVIQDLMRAVTAINVVFLQLAGIPALQHGNVIEVGSGFIGIEEACSGVRSLQATLMISLFLGELYSFNAVRRIILIGIGAALAFVCNVIRTAILVWVGTHQGLSRIESWHDPAGLTILIVCLFGLWVVSLVMMRQGSSSPTSQVIAPEAAPVQFGWAPLAFLAIWLILAEGAVQFWYWSHQALTSSHWAVEWPSAENNYKTVPIGPEAVSLLQYNEGGGASWEGGDGHQWLMFFFRWFPGRTAARFIKVHRPDICLPASGRTMERDNGIQMMTVNGVKLPIRSYRFEDRGAPLHVFYCYWDARSSYENAAAAIAEDWSFRGRVRTALKGRREIGAQILEIVVWGYEDDNEANNALARELSRVVRST
jgi:exosortase